MRPASSAPARLTRIQARTARKRISKLPPGSNPQLYDLSDGPEHRFLRSATHLVYTKQAQLITELGRLVVAPASTPRVLDWGSGKGHMTLLLNQQGCAVVSCDVEDGGSDSSFSQETPIHRAIGTEVVPLKDEVVLPFESASFDVVTSIGVLEHTQHDQESAKEIHRVLAPGGVFFISFLPRRWSWTQRLDRARGNSYHDRLYSTRQTRGLLEAAGFTVLDASNGQLFPKNSLPMNRRVERLDDLLCWFTPLGALSTNLTVVAVKR